MIEKCVLLVDDEEEIVNFLEHFLKRFSISSIKASSGEEALKIYDKDKICLTFLDIQLGGIDGITVLGELKKKHSDVKVIMITGKAEKEFKDKAASLGVLGYVTKPLDLSELKAIIHKYILVK